MTRRRALAAVAVAALLSLTACDATVSTDITVTSGTDAKVSVEARFTGQAAEAISTDAAAREQLLGVFSDRTGLAPDVESGDGELTVRTHLTYEQLTRSGDLLGVRSVALAGTDDRATITLKLAPPSKLADAVRAATSKQPDADALAATMLRSTRVSVSVTFPGGIESVAGDGAARDGNTVTVTRTADSTRAGELTVTGDPTRSRWPYVAAGAGVLVAGLLAVRLRRR